MSAVCTKAPAGPRPDREPLLPSVASRPAVPPSPARQARVRRGLEQLRRERPRQLPRDAARPGRPQDGGRAAAHRRWGCCVAAWAQGVMHTRSFVHCRPVALPGAQTATSVHSVQRSRGSVHLPSLDGPSLLRTRPPAAVQHDATPRDTATPGPVARLETRRSSRPSCHGVGERQPPFVRHPEPPPIHRNRLRFQVSSDPNPAQQLARCRTHSITLADKVRLVCRLSA